MTTAIKEFQYPNTVSQAASLLAKGRGKAIALAGGTRLPRAFPPSAEVVVDVSSLPLRHIRADSNWLRIGALCTFEDLIASPVLGRWAGGVIVETARLGTSAPARAMGTVGGNIVRPFAINNLPPLFLAFDAQVAYHDGLRERAIPFSDLVKPELMRLMGTRALVTEVRIPLESRRWSGAASRLARVPSDWDAVVNCVVLLEKKGGLCRKSSIALGAVTPKALRFPQAEKLLEGKAIDEALAREAARAVSAALNPAARGVSKDYAKEASGVLVRRALLEAFERAS